MLNDIYIYIQTHHSILSWLLGFASGLLIAEAYYTERISNLKINFFER